MEEAWIGEVETDKEYTIQDHMDTIFRPRLLPLSPCVMNNQSCDLVSHIDSKLILVCTSRSNPALTLQSVTLSAHSCSIV